MCFLGAQNCERSGLGVDGKKLYVSHQPTQLCTIFRKRFLAVDAEQEVLMARQMQGDSNSSSITEGRLFLPEVGYSFLNVEVLAIAEGDG